MLKAEILSNNQIIVEESVVSDSIKHEKIKFIFPKEWEVYEKTAVFSYEDKVFNIVLNSNNILCTGDDECYIPHEVIKSPKFFVSVFGICGEKRATTNKVDILVLKSGYELGDIPNEPTPDEYSQITQIMNETKAIAQSVRDDANNGVFNGEKGDTGERGPEGKQGIQGIQGEKGDKGENGITQDISGKSDIITLTTDTSKAIKITDSGAYPIKALSIYGAVENPKLTFMGKNLFNKEATVNYSNGALVTVLETGIRVTRESSNASIAARVGYIIGKYKDFIGKRLRISANLALHNSENLTRASVICRGFAGINMQTPVSDVLYAESFYNGKNSVITKPIENVLDVDNVYMGVLLYVGGTTNGDYAEYTDLQIEIDNSIETEYEPYIAPNEITIPYNLAEGDNLTLDEGVVKTNIGGVQTDITNTQIGEALLGLQTNYPSTTALCDGDCKITYKADTTNAYLNLKKEQEILKQAIINLGGTI